MIEEVNRFTTGWVTYYRHAQCQRALRDLDGWLRRKLRCARLTQCKRMGTVRVFLTKRGVPGGLAKRLASSGKGWWRLTSTEQAKTAMPNAWFDSLGTGQDGGSSRRVECCWKPPWYVIRMPGGVRGGVVRHLPTRCTRGAIREELSVCARRYALNRHAVPSPMARSSRAMTKKVRFTPLNLVPMGGCPNAFFSFARFARHRVPVPRRAACCSIPRFSSSGFCP